MSDETNGIFDEANSIFPGEAYEDRTPDEPVVTRVEEDEDLVGHATPQRGGKAEYRELLAQWDERGNCRVAWSANGRLLEQYRLPTKQEWTLLKERGEWVKGGLQGVQGVEDVSVGSGAPGLLSKVPWWGFLLGGLAVGGGALWAYSNYKATGSLLGSGEESEEGEEEEPEPRSVDDLAGIDELEDA